MANISKKRKLKCLRCFNGYYKKGYKLKEWNTKTNGSGESYKDQQNISVDSNKTVTKK